MISRLHIIFKIDNTEFKVIRILNVENLKLAIITIIIQNLPKLESLLIASKRSIT